MKSYDREIHKMPQETYLFLMVEIIVFCVTNIDLVLTLGVLNLKFVCKSIFSVEGLEYFGKYKFERDCKFCYCRKNKIFCAA